MTAKRSFSNTDFFDDKTLKNQNGDCLECCNLSTSLNNLYISDKNRFVPESSNASMLGQKKKPVSDSLL